MSTRSGCRVAGGSVVAHLPFDSRRFLGSPSIVVRADGTWLVSHDVFGTDSDTSLSYVHESVDGGRGWTTLAVVEGAFWSTLFDHDGALYLLGTDREYGALVVRRSVDGGRTWTEPSDARSGRLTTHGRFHTAPVPLVAHDGRLWRGFEQLTNDGGEWGHFAAGLMSAPLEADLLQATSWTLTPPLAVPEAFRSQGVRSWLEGNAVLDPSGQMLDVLRADRWQDGGQSTAVLRLVAPDQALEPVAEASLRPMPGGGSKFVVRHDPDRGVYWSVGNTALFDASATLGLRARNTLSLSWSVDLQQWHVAEILMHHPDDARHGFQYPDWTIDGADLVVAIRTAHDLDGRDAHNYHDSNLVTVLRVADFRRLLPASA